MGEEIVKEETTEEIDFLNMSDEDFEKMDTPDFIDTNDVVPPEDVVIDPEKETPVVTEEKPEEEVVLEIPEEEEKVTEEEPIKKDDESNVEEEPQVDYEKEYKALLASFTSDGMEVTPKSVEDARRLMELGVSSHGKVEAMKPMQKTLKILENNGLMKEGALDLLIEANNGNPQALAKLMSQHELNPVEMDVDSGASYTPQIHDISAEEMSMDAVINEIKNTPKFTQTVDVLTKTWDEGSREAATKNPRFVAALNEHVHNGTYDQVMSAVKYDKMMGRLPFGTTDYEAYHIVGERLEQAGAFKQPTVKDEVPAKKVNQIDDAQRKALKKAVSTTNSTSKVIGKVPSKLDIMSMSEEEFNKIDPKSLGIEL